MSDRKLRLRSKIIGEETRDGTIYCGISPHTNLPFYLEQVSSDQKMPWPFALTMARKSRAHGYNDWRLPTLDELHILFENRNAIQGFSYQGAYWASAPHYLQSGWAMSFRSGEAVMLRKCHDCFYLCVRGMDPFAQ